VPFPSTDHQFKPGQSGNPNGYSRGRRITDELVELIGANKAEIPLAKVWLRKALEGDSRFFRLLIDRLEDPADLVGSANRPIELEAGEPPKRIIIPDADDRLESRED
jgi:hypothetical protein